MLAYRQKQNEMTIHTLPYLKCNILVSVRSNPPCYNVSVQIALTEIKLTCAFLFPLFFLGLNFEVILNVLWHNAPLRHNKIT